MFRRYRLPAGAPLSWVLLALVLSAAPSRAGDTSAAPIEVRPFTPLRAALEQIAHDRGVPLAEVLADPARWLVGDDNTSGGGDIAHTGRQPSVATIGEDLPIRFAVPRLLGERMSVPVVGDINGDGIFDAAAQEISTGLVRAYEGDATHPLIATHDAVLDAGDQLQALADVDHDGRADLVAARGADGSVAIYRALAGWTFAPAVRHTVGFAMSRVFAADVTGDGRPELVAAGASVVRTLVNDGAGAFTPWVSTAIANYSGPATFADFDGDGRVDAALRNAQGLPNNAVTFLHGTPDGTLAAWSSLATPADDAVSDLCAADFDRDGVLDLASGGDYTVRLWRGDGAGGFAPLTARALDVRQSYLKLSVGDFDRDGRVDVLAVAAGWGGYSGSPSVVSLRGDGAGGLAPGREWMSGDPNLGFSYGPVGLATADFDADGALDALAAHGSDSGGAPSLLLNDRHGAFLAPAIHHMPFSPNYGPYRVDAVRTTPGQPETVLLWDGTRTWAGAVVGASGFDHADLFATGEVVSTQDLNADALDDLTMVRGDSIRTHLALGGGAFAPPTVLLGESWLACADFDGVNGPDMAVADVDRHVLVRANDGTGHFGAPVDWGVVLASDVSSVSGADLDRDGRAELLVGRNLTSSDDSVTIYWSASGHFGDGDTHRCGIMFEHGGPPRNSTHPATMAPGDFDGNGWPDLYVVHATLGDNFGSVSILLNMGGHAFLPAVDYEAGRDPWMGVVEDFDRDGLDDVAVVLDQDNWNGAVRVYRSGFGGVLTPMDHSPFGGITAQHYPTSMALGDWDMDGRRDFVVGNVQGRTVGFYRNQSPLGLPTTTVASLVSATARPDGVHLEWFVSAPSFAATLERATVPDAWQPVGPVSADGSGRIAWIDTGVLPGDRVGYRLAWGEGGATRHGGETWLDVPGTDSPRLLMSGARPNPAHSGSAVLVFTLPRTGDATLEVFDVAGRVVTRETLPAAAAGQHARTVSRGRALAPGLYLARLSQGEQHSTARFVVAE